MPTILEPASLSKQLATGEALIAPKDAGILSVGTTLEATFAKGKEKPREKPKRDANGHYSFPVALLARTPDPIGHWYWGKIVHNLAGCQTSGPQVSLDWLHDADAIFGAGKCEVKEDGLWLTGDVASFRDGDDGDRVWDYLYGPVPIPLEASIQFDLDNGFKWSYIEQNQVAIVNGRRIEGECMVIDQWLLRRVAICPSGRDPGTKTKALSADQQGDSLVNLSLSRTARSPSENAPSKESAMSVENTAAKPPETPAKPVEGQQAAPPATPAAPAAPTAKSFSAEDLSKFMARFGGEQGAKWLAEGKTYAEALELFATSQQDQLKESAAELSKKDETIKAMKLGHQSPAAFQGEGTNPTEQAAGADPAAAFANKIVGEFKKIRGES